MSQYDFQMINQDLSESKLLRTTSNFGMLKGRSIADLLYLQTLQLIMFNRDSKQRDYSVGYARKTTQFGPYALFRTTSTDIYVLAFALDHPEYESLNISTREQKILKSVQFQNRRHFNFIKRMEGRALHLIPEDVSYLNRGRELLTCIIMHAYNNISIVFIK